MSGYLEKTRIPIKTGWGVKLSFNKNKKTFTFHNWKLRRFELDKMHFRYSNEALQEKGSIPRSMIVFAEAIELSSVPHWNPNSFTKYYPFPIRVWVSQVPFFFCVATELQQQRWVAAINNQQISEQPMRPISVPPHKVYEL